MSEAKLTLIKWLGPGTASPESLVEPFKKLSGVLIEHTSEEPNWEKVKIIHAWGSPNMDGIYYEVCKKHNIEYRDLSAAKSITNVFGQEFDAVCEEALSNNSPDNFKSPTVECGFQHHH